MTTTPLHPLHNSCAAVLSTMITAALFSVVIVLPANAELRPTTMLALQVARRPVEAAPQAPSVRADQEPSAGPRSARRWHPPGSRLTDLPK